VQDVLTFWKAEEYLNAAKGKAPVPAGRIPMPGCAVSPNDEAKLKRKFTFCVTIAGRKPQSFDFACSNDSERTSWIAALIKSAATPATGAATPGSAGAASPRAEVKAGASAGAGAAAGASGSTQSPAS
jgi:hypothetical protein